MPRSAPRFALLALLLLLTALPVFAHNGAVAIAVPLEGITVDGDLSDWPEGMLRHPILNSRDGAVLDPDDLRAFFRLGYNAAENALLVAVEVRDESTFIDTIEGGQDPQDGCDLFVNLRHAEEDGSALRQWVIWGNTRRAFMNARLADAEVRVRRAGRAHHYEWRVDVGAVSEGQVQIAPNTALGLEVAVWDVDVDGTSTYARWGTNNTERETWFRGDAQLLAEGEIPGVLTGRVRWEDLEEGMQFGRLRALSEERPWLTIEAKTDSTGRYALDLPAGSYRVSAGYRRRSVAIGTVDVLPGEVVALPTSDLSRPPVGLRVSRGAGQTIRSGSRIISGEWEVLDASNGLPSPYAGPIEQDSTGALWIGTTAGLVRYDGANATTYSSKDGLPHDVISCLMIDTHGSLWIGTRGGLSRYDGEVLHNYTVEDGFRDPVIVTIAADSSGTVWVGTARGLYELSGDRLECVGEEVGLANQNILSLHLDLQRNLWIGTGTGLAVRRSDGVIKHVMAGLLEDGVTAVLLDRQGVLWCGSPNGVVRRHGQSFQEVDVFGDEQISRRRVNDILQDPHGGMWFATMEGLVHYEGTQARHHTPDNGLSSYYTTALLVDREGYLWASTVEGGVNRHAGRSLQTYTVEHGLGNNDVLSAYCDRDGVLWFGHKRGVTRYDGSRFVTLTPRDGLGPGPVTDIVQDRHGIWWFGAYGSLTRYDGRQFEVFTVEDGLPGNMAGSLAEDGEGRLWVATLDGGAGWLEAGVWHSLGITQGLPSNRATDVTPDGKGGVWVAMDVGVSHFDGTAVTTYTEADGIGSGRTRSILRDSEGVIWAARADSGGLGRYDGRQFTRLTTAEGLPLNDTWPLLEASDGTLWVGTFGGGVARYDGVTIQALTQQDGLANNAVQDLTEDDAGNVWIATAGGVSRYAAGQRSRPVAVVDLALADRRYERPRRLKIPSTIGLLSFEYHGSSFKTRSDGFVYRVRLRGHEDWKTTRAGRVDYADLPTGNYVFDLVAVDRDLGYSPTVEIPVIVHPPYGQIAVGAALVASLLGLATASAYGLRRRRDQRRAEQALMQDMEEELQTAHDMQMGLMPMGSPGAEGLSISGRCVTANDVGGDFFQYFEGDDALTISLADVTGHAMEAAIPAVMFSGILDKQMEIPSGLEERFAGLNRSLCRSLGEHTYVCLSMLDLDSSTRRMKVANCGCPYPLLYHEATGQIEEIQVEAYPLGIRPDTEYAAKDVSLQPGDYVVLHSDGFSEAANVETQLFGFDRTMEVIWQGCSQGLSPEGLIERLIGEVKAFTGDEPQGDDMTCVVVRVEA